MTGRRRARRSPFRKVAARLGPLVVLVLLAAVVQDPVQAAFTARETSQASLKTATVSLSSDASATVPLAVTDLRPGSTGSTCVTVSSTSDAATEVRVYATATSGSLGSSLTWSTDVVPATGVCADRAATTTLSSGTTLAVWGTAHASWASGLGSWTATPGATRTYRFTWTLVAGSGTVSRSAATTLVWEARTG